MPCNDGSCSRHPVGGGYNPTEYGFTDLTTGQRIAPVAPSAVTGRISEVQDSLSGLSFHVQAMPVKPHGVGLNAGPSGGTLLLLGALALGVGTLPRR